MDVAPPTNQQTGIILGADGMLQAADTPENRTILRRLEACLNACDGLSTDELEGGIVQDMRRVIADVVPVLEEKRDMERELVERGITLKALEPQVKPAQSAISKAS